MMGVQRSLRGGSHTCNSHHGNVNKPSTYTFELTFKCIWTDHLSKRNKGCALVGTKTSNNNSKSNNTTTTISNVCILCLPTTTFA